MARAITASKATGMPPPAWLGAGGGSERWAHSRASSVSAGNGTPPVSMWKSIAPSA